MRALMCVAALGAVTSVASAETSLVGASAGYTFFNRDGASWENHAQDRAACQHILSDVTYSRRNTTTAGPAGGWGTATVDACYAGSMQQPKATSISQSLNNFYTLINNANSGTAFLLSSADTEVSLEDNGLRQGVFSHFLIKGLKGEADQNADKMVQLGELFQFVTKEVKRYTLNRHSPYTAGRFDQSMPVAFIR